MSLERMLLPGIDCFQLLIDHHSKQLGGPGHEARLAIFLDGRPGEQEIRDLIASNNYCKQLSRVHVTKHGGVGYPALSFASPREIPLSSHQVAGSEIPEDLLQVPVDVFHAPPLAVQVIYFGNGQSCLLFTFHHILFDFSGVQSFVHGLNGQEGIPLLPPKPQPIPLNRRFRNFFREVVFTFREANWRMMVPDRPLPAVKKHCVIHHEFVFTREETRLVDECAKKAGAALNPGMFQLACVCKAMHEVIYSRQDKGFLWVPVPVNVRRKGIEDALLFNGLTFLFYKLFPKDLQSTESVVTVIRNQMTSQMRRDMPQAFVDFSDAYRYVPMFLYYPMLHLPSLGKLSSFNFSTLGDTFSGFDEFLGKKVLDVRNYPSNAISPGITFLFYRFRGQLRLMTSWVEGQYSSVEQGAVLNLVVGLMMNCHPGSPDPG